MTALGPTGLFCHPEVTGINNHTLMGCFLISCYGITQMAGRTTHHIGCMGWIWFFILMTGEAHFQKSGGCNLYLIRSFSVLLLVDKIADNCSDTEQGNKGWDVLGWFGHSKKNVFLKR
jgi:hypothetical protein